MKTSGMELLLLQTQGPEIWNVNVFLKNMQLLLK